jgi:hypothetical protein
MELLMVVAIIGLIAGISAIAFGAMWGNQKFERPVHKLVNTFQMAQTAAAESGRRYEVVIDLDVHGYLLREFDEYRNLEFAMNEDDPAIIKRVFFNEEVTLEYVLYDDGEDSRDIEGPKVAPFRVGKAGWQNGAKIVLLDKDGWPWTIVIHRFAKPPELFEGDVDILLPQKATQIPF